MCTLCIDDLLDQVVSCTAWLPRKTSTEIECRTFTVPTRIGTKSAVGNKNSYTDASAQILKVSSSSNTFIDGRSKSNLALLCLAALTQSVDFSIVSARAIQTHRQIARQTLELRIMGHEGKTVLVTGGGIASSYSRCVKLSLTHSCLTRWRTWPSHSRELYRRWQ